MVCDMPSSSWIDGRTGPIATAIVRRLNDVTVTIRASSTDVFEMRMAPFQSRTRSAASIRDISDIKLS